MLFQKGTSVFSSLFLPAFLKGLSYQAFCYEEAASILHVLPRQTVFGSLSQQHDKICQLTSDNMDYMLAGKPATKQLAKRPGWH